MSNSSKRDYRLLRDVLPPAEAGLQANFCRDPRCWNYGVGPNLAAGRSHNPSIDESIGRYSLHSGGNETKLKCFICGSTISLLSNVALQTEIDRLRTANGVLKPASCPNDKCENHAKPASGYPAEYYAHGLTPSGSERLRCKRCKSTVTLGDHRRRNQRKPVNKDIVLDLVNRGALRGIMRKFSIGPDGLYDRIDFIHEQMVAFETYKLQKIRRIRGKHRRHFALATDSQDHQVNWASRFRRFGVKVSAISTADNLTGFIFRTDVNFDPTTGDVVGHFEALLRAGDFDTVEGLGLSHRYALRSYFDAVRYVLSTRPKTPENLYLLSRLEGLDPKFSDDNPASVINPVKGVVVGNMYTAIAHFMLVSEILPSDAEVHVMTDVDGSLVGAVPVGLKDLFKDRKADFTYVQFDKHMKTPAKQQRVADYKKKLEEFSAGCEPSWDATKVRHAFIDEYKTQLPRDHAGQAAAWWRIPVQTMVEPDRNVGIVYQRPAETADLFDERMIELLDRASLHAVDSFFNVMRSRVSFFHRAGLKRSSETFYNPFQPYRPDMVQKVADIARVYFNWVEPRPFRVTRSFKGKLAKEHSSATEHLEKLSDENNRQERREAYTTPAMRMFLASSPIRLETILYTDWHEKLFPVKKARRAAGSAKPRRSSLSSPLGIEIRA